MELRGRGTRGRGDSSHQSPGRRGRRGEGQGWGWRGKLEGAGWEQDGSEVEPGGGGPTGAPAGPAPFLPRTSAADQTPLCVWLVTAQQDRGRWWSCPLLPCAHLPDSPQESPQLKTSMEVAGPSGLHAKQPPTEAWVCACGGGGSPRLGCALERWD